MITGHLEGKQVVPWPPRHVRRSVSRFFNEHEHDAVSVDDDIVRDLGNEFLVGTEKLSFTVNF